MSPTPVTLCFLLRDAPTGTEVLLGLKRTGFGIGKIVGVGGHVEPGENDAEAVVREVWEEIGRGGPGRGPGPRRRRRVHLSRPAGVEHVLPALHHPASGTANPPRARRSRPSGSSAGALPLHRMWQDAEHWLPPALAGETIDVVVVLNEDNETVASVRYPSRPG